MSDFSNLIHKKVSVLEAPRFVPSVPEVITTVKRAIMPGSSEFMPAGSLRDDEEEEEEYEDEF